MARPRGFQEDDVLRRAQQPFTDHGYAATSVDALTAATGLRKSSLYGAFGDKHALFLRVFDRYCEQEMGQVEAELDAPEGQAWAGLRAHVDGKLAGANPPGRGCLLAKETAELAGEDAEVARLAAVSYRRYETALSDCVRRAQRDGDVRADVDPEAAGALLLTVLRGIEALGRADHAQASLRVAADLALGTLASPPSDSNR